MKYSPQSDGTRIPNSLCPEPEIWVRISSLWERVGVRAKFDEGTRF